MLNKIFNNNKLSIEEILFLEWTYKNKYKDLPKVFKYEYNITPKKVLKKLKKQNFIRPSKTSEKINKLSVKALKNILSQENLKISGSKNILISRAIENIELIDSARFLNFESYSLTSKGTELINENQTTLTVKRKKLKSFGNTYSDIYKNTKNKTINDIDNELKNKVKKSIKKNDLENAYFYLLDFYEICKMNNRNKTTLLVLLIINMITLSGSTNNSNLEYKFYDLKEIRILYRKSINNYQKKFKIVDETFYDLLSSIYDKFKINLPNTCIYKSKKEFIQLFKLGLNGNDSKEFNKYKKSLFLNLTE